MAHVGIYILCGGASSRMGVCKTQVEFQGRPLLSYILDTVANLNHDVYLVCKSHQQDALKAHGLPIITDISNQTHPLEGVISALNHAHDLFQSIVILPCDTPRLSQDSIQHLLQDAPAVIVDESDRIHPLMLHIPLSWLERCQIYLDSQGSMRDFAALAHKVTVPIHETINLNHPKDLIQSDEVIS